jgi:predicted Zn-dependent protease
MSGLAGGADHNPSEEAITQARQDYDRALTLIRAGQNQAALPLLASALKVIRDNIHLKADYLLCLVWTGAYQQAGDYYRMQRNELQAVRYVPRNAAKAFYELRNFTEANALYKLAWTYDPHDAEAFKGVIYSYCRLKDLVGAYKAWEEARRKKLIPAGVLAEMEVFLLEYVGASSQAYRRAQETGAGDPGQLASFKDDMAVARLRWEEYDQALILLQEVVRQEPDNFRAGCDYLAALRKKDRMPEVLEQFALLQKLGRPIPYWVTEAVADAYLYLRKPREAESYYKMVLEQKPDNPFDTLLGLFNTYVDLQDWGRATRVAEQLEALLAAKKENLWTLEEKNKWIAAKGWFLLYQDKLKEGQEYFDTYLKQAGLSGSLRGGLAHAYLWRHWPRRAWEQFRIVQHLDPKDHRALTGLALTLNELNYKNEARQLASQLYQRYPTDSHVRDLRETLRVEEMFNLSPEFTLIQEFKGATEYLATGTVEAPYSPLFKLYGQIIRQYISEKVEGQRLSYHWDRTAFGFDWILAPQLTLKQAVSFDYLLGRDVASYTKVGWWPTDPLKISGEFDSFSLDVPIRARARGIRSKQGNIDINYLESDLRNYGLSLGVNWLSDNNLNPNGTLRFSQNVLNHPEVKVRLGGEFNYSRYTKNDVDYYSPLFDYILMFTPEITWTHYARYDRKWQSRFTPRGGVNREYKQDFLPVAGITYEQVLTLSKTFNLTWNASYDLKVYSGNYTHVLGAYFTFKKYF